MSVGPPTRTQLRTPTSLLRWIDRFAPRGFYWLQLGHEGEEAIG
jgi:hypothetical protein